MAYDDELSDFENWLRGYNYIVDPTRGPNGVNRSTQQYEMYYAYTGDFSLPDVYIGEIQGFDIFLDPQHKMYMVKYSTHYALIPVDLFELAHTSMDASELNTFFCRALFDNIDITSYINDFIKNKRIFNYEVRNYQRHNQYYTPPTEEEIELAKIKESERLTRLIEEQKENDAQAKMILTLSNKNSFWGLLIYEDVL